MHMYLLDERNRMKFPFRPDYLRKLHDRHKHILILIQ